MEIYVDFDDILSETALYFIQEGHEVKIITGRPYSSCSATKQWLQQHSFPPLEVVHVDNDEWKLWLKT